MTSGAPKYSRPEIERRWLVDATVVGDLSTVSFRFIEDLYVHESRLRLRKIVEAGGDVVYKLGKKYGKRSTLSEPITTLYLDAAEFKVLNLLSGERASKRRYSLAGGNLDVYERPLPNLMIFELEFESETAAREYRPPDFVTTEITNEPEHSGFQIARGCTRQTTT